MIVPILGGAKKIAEGDKFNAESLLGYLIFIVKISKLEAFRLPAKLIKKVDIS